MSISESKNDDNIMFIAVIPTKNILIQKNKQKMVYLKWSSAISYLTTTEISTTVLIVYLVKSKDLRYKE